MSGLERLLVVLTLTACLTSSLNIVNNQTDMDTQTEALEETFDRAVNTETGEQEETSDRVVDDCAEDEWSCHEKGRENFK